MLNGLTIIGSTYPITVLSNPSFAIKRKCMVMIVSIGTIIKSIIIRSHLSLKGKFIFARAYPASPFTIIPSIIKTAA